MKLPRGKIISTHKGGLKNYESVLVDQQANEFSGYLKITTERDEGSSASHVILRNGAIIGCIHSYKGDHFGGEAVTNIATDVQRKDSELSVHALDPSMILSFYPELKIENFPALFAEATGQAAPAAAPAAAAEPAAVEEAPSTPEPATEEPETGTGTDDETGPDADTGTDTDTGTGTDTGPATDAGAESAISASSPSPAAEDAAATADTAAAPEADNAAAPTAPKLAKSSSSAPSPAPAPSSVAHAPSASHRTTLETSTLNPQFTFDNFIVGDNNRFTHAAARAVAETPSDAYNPLFIYGGVGLGKTHLLTAIGNYIIDRDAGKKIVYVSSEKFMNELINSIRYDEINEFRERYRTVDVLLIDDIQFIAGKESTQQEFFHTFNALYNAHKQIVITSDRLPKDIPTLEDRLRSRFEGGLITDMQPPNLETRAAILRRKIAQEQITIPGAITEFIAEHVRSNIRELEGSLTKVIAYAELTSAEITLDLARVVLKDILEEEDAKRLESETQEPSAAPAPGGRTPPKGNEEADIYKTLKLGRSYMVEEERPALSFKLLEIGLQDGRKGFCIARTNPRQIRDSYTLDKAEIQWLTDRDSDKEVTISPSLESLIYSIQEIIEERENIIVLLDGLEFLIDNNGFNPVIRFLRQMIDDVSERDAILIIPLSPYVVSEQELKSLERELIPLTKALSRATKSKSFAQALTSLSETHR